MKQYQHYSFDLWMTLIKSNPLFKQERTKFFHRHFNPQHQPIETVAAVFRQVDLMCNAINEKTGGNIDAEEMYLMVINGINGYRNNFSDVDMEQLYTQMEQLLFTYPPEVYDNTTVHVLSRLQQTGNTTLSLLSNTGFIKGRTLRLVLQQIGLDQFFSFQLYSDEEGMSKPNTGFFKLMLKRIDELWKDKPINSSNIIHVGDNSYADIEGAHKAGINSCLVNVNNNGISSLIKQW